MNNNTPDTIIQVFVIMLGLVSFWVSAHIMSWLPESAVAASANAIIALSPANKHLLITLFFYCGAFVFTLLITTSGYFLVLNLFRASVTAVGRLYFSGYLVSCVVFFSVTLLFMSYDTRGIIEFNGHMLSYITGASMAWAGVHRVAK
ncbi:hypothetical protein [Alteromonas sp. H39]|uniref:hypothetical protein n=1 Tax=Alteromonas sp. H39 TaxID=3389876 RepID=UPI0039E1AFF3